MLLILILFINWRDFSFKIIILFFKNFVPNFNISKIDYYFETSQERIDQMKNTFFQKIINKS